MPKQEKLLIIGCNWPEPNASAAGTRMHGLIAIFLKKGYKITFASTAATTASRLELEVLGIITQTVALNDADFDDFLLKLKPKIVLFDRFVMEEQFGWRVVEYAPDAIRILDTEDLHSLRSSRETALKNNETWHTDHWLADDITKREIASILRCDFTLIISTYEMELLQDSLKLASDILLYLPFMVPTITKESRKVWPAFGERSDFVFIGTAKHSPNVDAIKYLKTEIWPLVRAALPDANLHIYGSYFPPFIDQMHKPSEGFYVEGAIADAITMMRNAKVNLAPLRFGAGIKGKLLLAMQTGTPSVTTPIGAEGMFNGLPYLNNVATTAAEFAKAAILLFQSEAQWNIAQANGINFLNDKFDISYHEKHFIKKLESFTTNLAQRRLQNFMGGLLQHQSMASTKYMSRWIEEKNRNRHEKN